MAELADALDLGSSGRPCRFDSCHPQYKSLVLLGFFNFVLHTVLHIFKIIVCPCIHITCFVYHCMSVNFFQNSVTSPSSTLHNIRIRYAYRVLDACAVVPLRYNNDKQKKPLFSRGLSVCRLLFNSFSKLKIDENYKEKRRLFY